MKNNRKKLVVPTLKLKSVPQGCPSCGSYLRVLRTETSGGVEIAVCKCTNGMCNREWRFPV